MSLESLWREHIDSKSQGQSKDAFDRGYRLGVETCKKLTYNDAIKNKSLIPTNLAWYSHINRKSPQANGKVVAIFANSNIQPGQHEDPEQIPFGASSEVAVYMMANSLAKMNYHVYVFCNFDTKQDWKFTLPLRNPQYLPINRDKSIHLMGPTSPGFILSFEDIMTLPDDQVAIDELIVWSITYDENYQFNNYAKNVHLWYISIQGGHLGYEPKSIYTLSTFHSDYIMEHNPHINPELFNVGCMGTDVQVGDEIITKKRKSKSCIYASSRIRGLLDLLEMWGDILKVHPTATLVVAYGKQTYTQGVEDEMTKIDELILKYKKSIFDMDKLSRNQLKKVIGQQSFCLYSYKLGDHTTETFSSIVAICGRLGTIPIVRRRHGLVETAAPQDGDLLGEGEYLSHVIEMLSKSDEELYPIRTKWIEHCKQYSWENAATIMSSRFN